MFHVKEQFAERSVKFPQSDSLHTIKMKRQTAFLFPAGSTIGKNFGVVDPEDMIAICVGTFRTPTP